MCRPLEYEHACVFWRSEANEPHTSLTYCPPCLLRKGLSLAWSLLSEPGWRTRDLQGPPCACLPNPVMISAPSGSSLPLFCSNQTCRGSHLYAKFLEDKQDCHRFVTSLVYTARCSASWGG